MSPFLHNNPNPHHWFRNANNDSLSDTDTHVTTESDASEFHIFGKYEIVLCEIFNPYIHGFTRESDKNVLGHYLVIGCYSFEFLMDYNLSSIIQRHISNIRNLLEEYPKFCRHPWVRNYKQHSLRSDYIRPEIAECILLNGNEKVAIIKTFWLRIIQRTWKRVFQERCNIQKKRTMIYSLGWRQVHGRWPDDCSTMPTIHGMLSGLHIRVSS